MNAKTDLEALASYFRKQANWNRSRGEIPQHCNYWRFQGDHNMIGCEITGCLCDGNSCDPNKVDPTGFLRNRIDKQKMSGGFNH